MVLQHCAGCGEERFGGGDDRQRRARRGRGVVVIGQALDLRSVEDPIAFQERNFTLDGRAVVGGFGFRKAGGVNDQCAVLSLADMPVELQRLLERHPQRRLIAARDGLDQQHEDVDAAIGRAVVAERTRNPAGRVIRVPGFDPGPDALLQLGDDAVGDGGVNIAPFGCRCHDLCLFRLK